MPILQSHLLTILKAARAIEDIYLGQAQSAIAAIADWRAGAIPGDALITSLEIMFTDPLRAIGLEHGVLEVEFTKYRLTHRKNEINRAKMRESRQLISGGIRRRAEHTRGGQSQAEPPVRDAATQQAIDEMSGRAPDSALIPAEAFGPPGLSLAARARMTNDDLIALQRSVEVASIPIEERNKLRPAVITDDGQELM